MTGVFLFILISYPMKRKEQGMDKIQRSRPPKAKSFLSLHPVLKGFSLGILAMLLIALGYFAAGFIHLLAT